MTFESFWTSTIKVGPLLKPTDMPNCCDVYGSDIYRTGLAKVGGKGSNIPTYRGKIGKILPNCHNFFLRFLPKITVRHVL